jgi:large subunit ribosomal protein L1
VSNQSRTAVTAKQPTGQNALKYKRKDQTGAKKKKKARNHFLNYDLKKMEQFSLCDAMRYALPSENVLFHTPSPISDPFCHLHRYIQAFEVGYPGHSPKYEVHLKLRTVKNGPVVRNRLRLPHPIRTDLRVCVICPPDSAIAESARKAGASLVGTDEIFAAVKDGKIEFDRCVCHPDAQTALVKSGVARILGPRGLMPSTKNGTIVPDVAGAVRDMVGASEYRERYGVVRMAVGQLAFTPEQMQKNIKAFVGRVKQDMGLMSDRVQKSLHEVVLSSTHGPGFSLSGDFRSEGGVKPQELPGL